MTRPLTAVSLAAGLAALAAFATLSSSPARAQGPQPEPAPQPKEEPPLIDRSDAGAPEPFKLGLSAPLGMAQAEKDGRAVAAALALALGHPVDFEVLSPTELARKLANGRLDIGWLTALEYVAAAKASDGRVVPVAKAVHAGLPFYRSVLFTQKSNHSILTPTDLQGKKLAFVADTSSAGYVVPMEMLLNAGLTGPELKAQSLFVGDHGAVCRAVLDGTAEAGATLSNDKAGEAIAGCVETVGPQAADKLKVIATSDPIPNDVFALRPDATVEQFAQLRAALLDLNTSFAGRKVLADDLHAEGFTATEDGDFTPLRQALK